jgi:hypothetical protein
MPACGLLRSSPGSTSVRMESAMTLRMLALAAATSAAVGLFAVSGASAVPANGVAIGQAAAATQATQQVWWRWRRWHRWHYWRRW